jgi:hypothetical protein
MSTLLQAYRSILLCNISNELPNYEVNRRKAHLSDLTEVSLMGNGKSNEAERQELSGPGTSFYANYIIPANSCL